MIVHKNNAYDGEHEAIVDEALWDAVQESLAINACGSSRRRKHQNPSLLIGKVFDDEGRAMTPSHAQRGSRRYRYYVTRPGKTRESSVERVSAHDLEHLVCDQLAGRASDEQFVLDLLEGGELEVGELQRVRTKAASLAAKLRSGKSHDIAKLLEELVQRIDLHRDHVEVAICGTALGRELGSVSVAEKHLSITFPAVRVRRGHRVRLIIPGKESAPSALSQRDDKLIVLIAEAFEARKLVYANPEKPIASVAGDHGRCRTRLGKLVRLSCLAPDIVAAIVKGRQPKSLTAKSLSNLALPLAWDEQREKLGFG